MTIPKIDCHSFCQTSPIFCQTSPVFRQNSLISDMWGDVLVGQPFSLSKKFCKYSNKNSRTLHQENIFHLYSTTFSQMSSMSEMWENLLVGADSHALLHLLVQVVNVAVCVCVCLCAHDCVCVHAYVCQHMRVCT